LPGGAAGQEIDAEGIRRIAERLGSEDEAVRREAFERLTSLDEEALPAIEQRIRQYRLPRERVHDITADHEMRGFRRAAGDPEEDPDYDIVNGVLPHLRRRQFRSAVQMAERVALMRALQRIDTMDAYRQLVDLTAVHDRLWGPERRRIAMRAGLRMTPVLIECRMHSSTRVRAWARRTSIELGVAEPVDAVQRVDVRLLPEVLRSYGRVRDMDAMQVIVGFLGHQRTSVREAARHAIGEYGRNAIWQLRRAYRLQRRQAADPSWSAERTLAELLRVLDEERIGAARADLDAGLAAMRDGRLAEVERRLDRVLAIAPSPPRLTEIATAYAAIGADRLDRGDRPGALRAYRRAARLAPAAEGMREWQAQIAFAEAEERRAAGVLDLPGYRRALELDPGHEAAADALERHSEEGAASTRGLRNAAVIGAAVLLALLGVFLVWPRRRREAALPVAVAEPPVAGALPVEPVPEPADLEPAVEPERERPEPAPVAVPIAALVLGTGADAAPPPAAPPAAVPIAALVLGAAAEAAPMEREPEVVAPAANRTWIDITAGAPDEADEDALDAELDAQLAHLAQYDDIEPTADTLPS
jgi:hypothetical protein